MTVKFLLASRWLITVWNHSAIFDDTGSCENGDEYNPLAFAQSKLVLGEIRKLQELSQYEYKKLHILKHN